MITPPPAMPIFNGMGFATLFAMEFRRYLKAWQHLIAAPIITTLMFFAIFDLALGGVRADIQGIAYLDFVAPGLVAMTVMLTAFEMTAWSTIDARIRGTMDAVISAPLRPIEFVGAHILSGALAGLANGSLVVIVMQPFVTIVPQAPATMLVFAAAGAIAMASVGMAAGIHAEKFDHVATVLSFIVSPAIFLSGVFYPVAAYGGAFVDLAHASPFFWAIDGFRQGSVGVGEAPVALSGALIWLTVVFVFCVLWALVARGYKLKR